MTRCGSARRATAAAALVLALGSVSVARAEADAVASPAPAPSSSTCSRVIDVAAFQMDGDSPVVIGREGEIARFAPFTLSNPDRPYDSKVIPPATPPTLTCTGITRVVGLAIDASGTMFVANERSVFRIARGASTIGATLHPTMNPSEVIRAVALGPSGAVQLAIGTPVDPSTSTLGLVGSRFAVYGPALGAGARPERAFRYPSLRGETDAMAIDSGGRTYVATAGAQIAIFSPTATGDVRPSELLEAPLNGLRPSLRGVVRGSRPLAFDGNGSLYAADDGVVVQFRFQQEAGTHVIDGRAIASGPKDGLDLVYGAATDSIGRLYIVTSNPDTHVRSIVVFPGIYADIGEHGRQASVNF